MDQLRCSFCSKSKDDVRKLIAGPLAFICDECVQVCVDIMDDERFEARQRGAEGPSSPPERMRLEPATSAALMDRVAALSNSDQWLLVMHLLARLRSSDLVS